MIHPKPEILQQWGIHCLSKQFIPANLAKVTIKMLGVDLVSFLRTTTPLYPTSGGMQITTQKTAISNEALTGI